MKRIGIIGAGLGGLSAAIRLANRGFKVDLFEQSNNAGGKASEINENGFRFDTGPSLLTMPFVIEQLFEECGKNIDNYLSFRKLDIICKYFYPDGVVINAYSDPKKFGNEIEKKTSDNAQSLKKYLSHCSKIYDLTADLFLFNSPTKLKTFLNSRALKALVNLHKIDTLRSMHKANKRFFKDDKLVQLFDRYATYNGSDPYRAPATLNIIPHVEYTLGSFLPEDGIYSISKALMKLAEEKGVNIYLNERVKNINIENDKAVGLSTDKITKSYDAIVSNVDVNTTYRNLLPNISNSESLRNLKLEPSFSGLVFYWGMNKEFDELETHNILFSSDYKKEFDDLFVNRRIPEDPTIYIYISAKQNKNDAPAGKENWFVMINSPYIQGQSWDLEINNTREKIINKINNHLKTDITKNILFEKKLSPLDIERKTGSYLGSIYGISSNDKKAAFLRQTNKSRSIKNLYFCGGSVHPGGGIPLVILSGKIASELVAEDLL